MLGICSLSVLVLYETLLVLVFLYDSETMLWREKERFRVKAVQMDNPDDCYVVGVCIESRMHG